MEKTPQRERPRLYLLTPPVIDDVDAFSDTLMACLDAGDVACLQIRLKTGAEIDVDATTRLGQVIIGPVQDRGVAVVINDSVDLAATLGADGVHLGPTDTGVKDARQRLGTEAIVGFSAKNSRHAAMEAGEAGADYVAFGAFYPTGTKETDIRASTDLLTIWQEQMELPCVAIGGITTENALPLLEAGADFLAVSSAVWAHPESPVAAIRAFNDLMDQFAPA